MHNLKIMFMWVQNKNIVCTKLWNIGIIGLDRKHIDHKHYLYEIVVDTNNNISINSVAQHFYRFEIGAQYICKYEIGVQHIWTYECGA
jgi:hypothetical protein